MENLSKKMGLKLEMYFIVIYFGIYCVISEIPKFSFVGCIRLYKYIIWILRPFLTFDSRLFRGKMNPQKIEKIQII